MHEDVNVFLYIAVGSSVWFEIRVMQLVVFVGMLWPVERSQRGEQEDGVCEVCVGEGEPE